MVLILPIDAGTVLIFFEELMSLYHCPLLIFLGIEQQREWTQDYMELDVQHDRPSILIKT